MMNVDPAYLLRLHDLESLTVWREVARELRAPAAEADMRMEVDLIVADHGVTPHPRGLE